MFYPCANVHVVESKIRVAKDNPLSLLRKPRGKVDRYGCFSYAPFSACNYYFSRPNRAPMYSTLYPITRAREYFADFCQIYGKNVKMPT
jgi:hypothetical protein